MTRRRARLRIRPTGFGLLLVGIVTLALVIDAGGADPQVAGLAWSALAAVVVIGTIWPLWVVATSTVSVRPTGSDVVVGDPVGFEVTVTSGGGPVEVSLGGGDAIERRWWSAIGRSTRSVAPTATGRCVLRDLEVEVRSSAPLGVLRVLRRHDIALAAPVWIAPAPIEQRWRVESTERRALDGSARQPSNAGDLVRSVRHYVPGDPAHLVHWPTSARAGELLIRELEPPGDLLVAVVVHLDDADDTVAGRAAGLVEAISEAGGSVILCTATEDGPAATTVASRLHAGRLLAAAIAAPPAPPPPGTRAEHVRSSLR